MKLKDPPRIQLSGLVWSFAHEMQKTLDTNRHKSGWEGLTPTQCLDRMKEETVEIEAALRDGRSAKEIVWECADVANFAAFLAANITEARP